VVKPVAIQFEAGVVHGVGFDRVGEGVDWFDVVDGVGFFATDGAGWVVFEELFSYLLK
jgi:hypothetical protein